MTSTVAGTFTATGQSSAFSPPVTGRAQEGSILWLSGDAVGVTIQLERSHDGSTWYPIYAEGVQLFDHTYTASTPVSIDFQQTVPGTQWRINCTAYASGTLTYKVTS